MKKYVSVFLTLFVLLVLTVPALAADAPSKSSAAPVEPIPSLTPIEPVAPIEEPAPAANAEAESRPGEGPTAPVSIVRRPGRGSISDILVYWEENGYPDDVAYAYESGGEMIGDMVHTWWEIGLVGNSEVRQEEILELISPFCMVEFKNALFTHGEKVAAYEKLTELAETDKNILEVVFVRNSDTVWVAVPEELAKEYAEYLIRDCGLGAVVAVTDENSLGAVSDGDMIVGAMTGDGLDAAAPIIETGGLVPANQPSGVPPLIWGCLILAVATTLALIVLSVRSFRTPAAVTESGRLHAAVPLSRRQVEETVKKDLEVPGETVYRALLERLKRTDDSSMDE